MVTKDIEKLLNFAHREVVNRHHRFLLTEHLLYAICVYPRGFRFLEECDIDVETLISELELFFNTQDADRRPLQPTTSVMVERIIKRAVEHSFRSEQNICSLTDVLASMMNEEESYAVSLLKKQNLTRLRVMKQSRVFENENYSDNSGTIDNSGHGDPVDDGNDSELSMRFSFDNRLRNKERDEEDREEGKEERKPSKGGEDEKLLREFLIDLNEKAKQKRIDPLIGRGEEMHRLLLILGRRKKNNPILVGDPGVGKTAIVEGLAREIVNKSIHERFYSYQVYALEMGALLAGTKFRGDFEERMTRIFAILKKKRNCIVFIDEIHTIVGAGTTTGSGMDASNLIKPMLTGGEVQVIGATTFEEYRNHFQKDAALNRRFEKVEIREPSIPETVEILKSLASYYEDFHQVRYPEEILESLPALCKNYFIEKHLPDGAIDVMDLAGSLTKMKSPIKKNSPKSIRPEVSYKEVEKLISKISGIPLRKIEYKNRFQVNEILKEVKKQVFGQDHVVERVVKVVKLSKLGLRESGRPIGSFLFTGPTGVGKTELCRVLSQVLGMSLVRLDMSEFMESHSVSKLIGAPPGYVGFNERGGELTEQVNKHPHCLLLLDEVEKAHPDVINTFLQVMDYGRLTDSSGRQVSFENTLIVMTSNLGAEEMSSLSMGFGSDTMEVEKTGVKGSRPKSNYNNYNTKGDNAVKHFFRPEFRNRLTAILKFNFLADDTIKGIVTKLLSEINDSLTDKNLSVTLEPGVIDYLLKKGYDPKMGGRSIKRVFETEIKERIADYVFSKSTGFFKNPSQKAKSVDKEDKGEKIKTALVFYLDNKSTSPLKIRTTK